LPQGYNAENQYQWAARMTSVNESHEQKATLALDLYIPGHEPRVTTPLFHKTRLALIERDRGRCYISGMTAEELGEPLEAHHYPLERCYATAIDWQHFADDCKAGEWGHFAQAFDWDAFFVGATLQTVAIPADGTMPAHAEIFVVPRDPYLFVDDMTVNGRLLGKRYHTGKNSGIHAVPHPNWLAQKYLKDGTPFSPTEVINHDDEVAG
jgi:hypothetical protein